MAKYLVETYYTCSFKVSHYLDEISEAELSNLDKRDDGKFEILDVKLDNRKTKNLDLKVKNTESKKIEIESIGKGKCYGIIQWIKFGIKNGISYENNLSKSKQSSGWQQVLYLFEEPIELKVGQKVSIVCKHDRNTPWFFLDKIDD